MAKIDPDTFLAIMVISLIVLFTLVIATSIAKFAGGMLGVAVLYGIIIVSVSVSYIVARYDEEKQN